MSRTYSPEEERYGLYLTLGLIAALTLLGTVFLAAGSGSAGESDRAGYAGSSGSSDSSGDSSGSDSGSDSGVGQPEDMSFVCDVTGYDTTDISSREREALETEAEDFVMAMWADPGSDPEEYTDSIEQRVVDQCFWDAPEAEYVNDRKEIAYRGGETEASRSEDGPLFASEFVMFSVSSVGSLEDSASGAEYVGVVGDAVWVSEKAGGGGEQAYQQQLTLVKPKDGGEWQVSRMDSTYDYIDSEYQHELPPGVEY